MGSLQPDSINLEGLKTWLVKKLEDISDADSDVLADYAIALIQSDDPEDQIRSNCVENLKDFLQDNTEKFVDEAFAAIRTKSYLPGYKPPQPKRTQAPELNATAPNFAPSPFPQPTSTTKNNSTNGFRHQQPQQQNVPYGHAQNQVQRTQQNQSNEHSGQSKKRSWQNRDGDEHDTQVTRNGDRPQKQMRRGGRNAPGSRGGNVPAASFPSHMPPTQHQSPQQQQPQFQPQPTSQNFSPLPNSPTGIPQIDPNNPFASLMAMQAMGFPMPFMEGFGAVTQAPQQQQTPGQKARCRDYDVLGYCSKGSTCPYDHGSDHIVVPEEYDPANSTLVLDGQKFTVQSGSANNSNQQGHNSHGKGRGHNHQHQRGERGSRRGGHDHHDRIQKGGRASFSHTGPNHDTRITSVVVEQLPEEHFNQDSIRTYFSEFGTIEDINLQQQTQNKRLAIVKFTDYTSAKAAYESPKAIFDNRFVKVYWYKPLDSSPTGKRGMNGHTISEGGGGRGRGKANSTITSNSAAHPNPTANDQDTYMEEEPQLSPEEFAKKQAEAQKAHEEKLRKQAEADQAKAEIDRRIKEQAEERKKLMEKLAAKSSKANGRSSAPAAATAVGSNTTAEIKREPSESKYDPTQTEEEKAISLSKQKTTEALRAKLAELEAEAEAMGLPPQDDSGYANYGYWNGYQPRGRGMSSYRGRGRGFGPSGAGGAGRGGGGGGYWNGGGVARLDNRPKNVKLKVLDDELDLRSEGSMEKLRGWLYNIGTFTAITPSAASASAANDATATNGTSTSTDTDIKPKLEDIENERSKEKEVTVSFPERYVAELFIASTQHTNGTIPGLGKVELSWVANAPATLPSSVGVGTGAGGGGGAGMGGVGGMEDTSTSANGTAAETAVHEEVDYDVADEMDETRW